MIERVIRGITKTVKSEPQPPNVGSFEEGEEAAKKLARKSGEPQVFKVKDSTYLTVPYGAITVTYLAGSSPDETNKFLTEFAAGHTFRRAVDNRVLEILESFDKHE